MKKRLLYLALALFGAPLLWGQSTVVCTTASPGTVIGSCASGFSSPVTTDPVSATGAWTFDNAANTPVTCSDGVTDSTLTAGRVTFAGASGRLSDDADLTFATDTLSATKVTVATTLTSPNLVAPVGSAQAVSATAPAATTGASQVGKAVSITASNAVASTDTAGAAAGGSVTLTAGNAARLTSGNADGGSITLSPGTGIGTGVSGSVVVGGAGLTVGTGSTNGRILLDGSGSNDTYIVGDQAAGMSIVTSTAATTPRAVFHSVNVETVATTKTPGSTESMELYTNGADVDGQAITLTNDPTVGVCFEFALTSTDSSGSFDIAPSAGETLQDAGTTCATSFAATAKGATARICAVSGGSGALWLVMSKNGTWTCS